LFLRREEINSSQLRLNFVRIHSFAVHSRKIILFHASKCHRPRLAMRVRGETLNPNQEVCLMERREFLKLTLGFTAAAGAIAATAMTAQAAPMLPQTGDALPPAAPKPAEAAARPDEAKRSNEAKSAPHDEKDTDMSARRRRFWRRRRRFFRHRRRRRVIFY
jgi:hypothetical protein